MKYRSLTDEEIMLLEDNGCKAEDWNSIYVAYDFTAQNIHRVNFGGEVYLGERLHMQDVGVIRTTDGATYGEGNIISVLNEAGPGNVMLFSGLTSQLAALMVAHADDALFRTNMQRLISEYVEKTMPQATTIGNGVTISHCRELTNVSIGDECELYGVSRLVDCTLKSTTEASIYLGDDVICDNVIIQAGASVVDGARLYSSYVGEACHVGRGFTSECSIFFANSHMDNGEACAAFCGPFSVSHHKSTLLIGGQYSFYNAGSGTNFSNHAYKMGPIHYGMMERGAKSASGSHILWPAKISAFSMVMGKLENHADISLLPFSYLITSAGATYIVPGRNLCTVGTYRDVYKWPKRDRRANDVRQSHICYDWLSPYTMDLVLRGREVLEQLQKEQGENAASYSYNGCIIKNSALKKGLRYYDMALRMYFGMIAENDSLPSTSVGGGKWIDLGGLMLPESEELQIVDEVVSGKAKELGQVAKALTVAYEKYAEYRWAWTYTAICDYHHLDTLSPADIDRIRQDGEHAHEEWLMLIKRDAEREYEMGDVSESQLQEFIAGLK